MLDPNGITTTSFLPFQGNIHSILLSGTLRKLSTKLFLLERHLDDPRTKKKHFSRARDSFSWWTKYTKEIWKKKTLIFNKTLNITVIRGDHKPPWFEDEIPTHMVFYTILSMGRKVIWLSGRRALYQRSPVGPGHHHNAAPWKSKSWSSEVQIFYAPKFELNLFMSWIPLGTKYV